MNNLNKDANVEVQTLTLDMVAVSRLSSALINDSSWFDTFKLPSNIECLKRVHDGNSIFLISKDADFDDDLLVIRTGELGVFAAADSPRHVLDRLLHIAQSTFTNEVTIPKGWKYHNEDNCFSIYAQPFQIGKQQRLHFERQDDSTLIAYHLTDGIKNFNEIPYDVSPFSNIRKMYCEACLRESIEDNGSQYTDGIVLEDNIARESIGVATFAEWRDSKLTEHQRKFVFSPPDKPIRLRGAAGTGKTISLVIKCIHEILSANNRGNDVRVAFITHSAGVSHDLVKPMVDMLIPYNDQINPFDNSKLWIGSFYELARDMLDYQSKRIQPISMDGIEGRNEQKEWIGYHITDSRDDTYIARSLLPKCSDKIKENYLQDPISVPFIREIMNEFASCLDAERIRKGCGNKAKEYVESTREQWQMELPNESDRQLILELHDRYCHELEKSCVMSLDQVASDFLRYLESHEWGLLNGTNGFDLIFVDELHYFNEIERMAFHLLFRGNAKPSGERLPLFMAYDLKQSTDDRFLKTGEKGEGARFFRSLHAGASELVELSDVFRYTPEIANFIQQLDGAFPALDLAGEWKEYTGSSMRERGELPTIHIYPTNTKLIDEIIGMAHREARTIGGRKVAVLCLNEDLFSVYAQAGRIAKFVSIVESRADLRELRYAGKKCILSMPEFVAGLQFDSVYLIHIDKLEMDTEESFGSKRRFLSRLYLGASRASIRLTLASSEERGGMNAILEKTLNSGVLKSP